MTTEEIKAHEESSRAFRAATRPYAEKIIKELGLNAVIDEDRPISHTVETEPCTVHGAAVKIQICRYGRMGGGMSNTINAEVTITLPEGGVMADAFLDHVAEKEGIGKDHYGFYSAGHKYATYDAERKGFNIEAYSPWNDRYLRVYARNYTVTQMEQATDDLLALARPMVRHLEDLSGLRYWKKHDAEVIAKAKEIIENAAICETDVDREDKSHFLRDNNSFFRGWFFPFNNYGKGTFDTNWPSSTERAAGHLANKGTFEYAVACMLLEDPAFIAKARKACIIRKKKITIKY